MKFDTPASDQNHIPLLDTVFGQALLLFSVVQKTADDGVKAVDDSQSILKDVYSPAAVVF